MSTRFTIKSTASKAEKEGDVVIRYTGVSEPFVKVSQRTGTKIGVDNKGNSILSFVTGLDESQVSFFKWYNEEEQKAVVKQIKELRKSITDFYGGNEVIDHKNHYFWNDTREVNRITLTNDSLNVFYDTKNPAHALFYLSVISGAFGELIAPTRDWAERHQTDFYLALETDETFDDEEDIKRSDAHALLSELRKESGDALFILAWCVQYDTNAFGAINKATPLKSLINTHIQYIDGKLVTKRKRDTARIFVEYAEKWKGQQTRPALFVEAYVKAGEYFSFINQREKKYVMTDGTVLGNTVEDSVAKLMTPKYTQDLEKLRKQVEDKWKE